MDGAPGSIASSCHSTRRFRRAVPLAPILTAILAAGAVAAILLGCSRLSSGPGSGSSSDPRSLPEAAPAYSSQISFSNLHLSAEENFLGQQVVYLDGQVSNRGPNVVRLLEVRLFFRNELNEAVLREEQQLLATNQSLGPGQARSFQIRFDQIPDSWNQQTPGLQIVSVRISEAPR